MGKRSKWVTVLEEKESGRHVVIPPGLKIDPDDERYGNDVHVVPVTKIDDVLSIGVHEFVRGCLCGPEIREQLYGRTLVVHTERVN